MDSQFLLTFTEVADSEVLVSNGDVPVVDFPKYAYYTWSVERCAKSRGGRV